MELLKNINKINKMIETSNNVFIMGHKFLDLDAIGASISIYEESEVTNSISIAPPTWIWLKAPRFLVSFVISPGSIVSLFSDIVQEEKSKVAVTTASAIGRKI